MKRAVVVLSIVALLAGAANAAVVSLNFENWGTIDKSADIKAGVVNAGYWNDTWARGIYDKWAPYSNLTDSTGAATTIDASWTAPGDWGIRLWDGTSAGADTAGTRNVSLMKGYLDAHAQEGKYCTVTFAEIPYALYNVYVYFMADQADRPGTVTDGATTYHFLTDPDSVHFTAGGTADYVDFKLATAMDAGSAIRSNYAVFSDMSGDSFTITSGIMYGGGIAGIQIVEVPEPATMVLLGLGSLLLRKKK